MSPIADAVINLIAEHGVLTVLSVPASVGAWCGLRSIARRIARRRRTPRGIRQLELFANDPDNHRKETP
ncbi:hypothetical protein ABT119_06280 [Streptomyces sp. NPDC001910]|uniref:hypothetical protein n=1 Tax=Streptomyces sp. NPDC001910 TaxID=3154403 RepID=UPI003332968A